MKNINFIKASNQELLNRSLNIRNNVFTVEKGISKEIEVDENDTLDREYDHFLATYDGKDIGALRCVKVSDSTVKVQRFCVVKEYRNLGLGIYMIEQVDRFYKSQGITKIELDAKFHVSGFYEKCGFIKDSDIFMEAGVEHVRMVKKI